MSTPIPAPVVRKLRLWPAWVLVGAAVVAIGFVRTRADWPFQQRNLATFAISLLTLLGLLSWWTFASRLRWQTRMLGLALLALGGGIIAAAVRLKGVSGDFVPIVETRWKVAVEERRSGPASAPALAAGATVLAAAMDFPQFLGPNRDGIVTGPRLATNWAEASPVVLWRQPIGAGWSGFTLVGHRALTQEQHGPEEWTSAYDLTTGRLQWAHTNLARYDTTIAGEGPRATPTVVSNRVYALGATGLLDCLELATGRRIWSRSLTEDGACSVPEWGYAGSPLVANSRVIVQAGGAEGRSLLAYDADSGELQWSGGSAGVNYASPYHVTLGGQPQILIFGRRAFTAHDPATGAVLWETPFGTGLPLVANPIVVSTNRVLITAGYNVGAELLEMTNAAGPPVVVWKSKRLKAKFANPVRRDGFVYGLDDGILVCLDLADGAQRWKEGRYGHGQGLWVGDLYLLMSEPGELILLRPTPEGPNELGRFPVFDVKTWNPIALRGDLLVVRNDREAACLRLPLEER